MIIFDQKDFVLGEGQNLIISKLYELKEKKRGIKKKTLYTKKIKKRSGFMDSINSFYERENNQSESTQRECGEQDNQFTSQTNVECVVEFDNESQSLNHDNQQNNSFIKIEVLEPFAFPLFMPENKNETICKTNKNDKQLFLLESSQGIKKQSLELNNESNTELDDNQIQQSTQITLPVNEKNRKIKNKRKFDATLIMNLLKYKFGEQTSFYLFADRMLDINYLKLLAKNQGEEKSYSQDQNKVCIFKGHKLVNKVFHRIDNKCIEIMPEEISKPFENFDQLLKMLLSLGDLHLFQMANNLQHFWENIQKYKNCIKAQSDDELFKRHMVERDKASNKVFLRTTSQLNQDQYIHYIYYKVDFENYNLFNYRTGYNPKLYELIAGNAYAFKESLLKDGYYDPIYLANRFNMCLDNYVSQFQPRDLNKQYYQSKFDHSFNLIRTLDGFFIPSIEERKIINLNMEYNTENNLNFKINDFLVIFNFKLVEENEENNIESQLREFRMGQKYSHESDQQLKQTDQILLEKQFKTELFLQKYYPDDITSLMKKGNKWFKQCGVADIPSKKRKEDKDEDGEEEE